VVFFAHGSQKVSPIEIMAKRASKISGDEYLKSSIPKLVFAQKLPR
jgi:hypothetical protein